MEPGQRLTISLYPDNFPKDVIVTTKNHSKSEKYNNLYQNYLYQDEQLISAIKNRLPDFYHGNCEDVLNLEKLRIHIAMENFSGTPYEIYIYRTMADYLIRYFEYLNNRRYRTASQLNVERSSILSDARDMGFFRCYTLSSLPGKVKTFIREYSYSFKHLPPAREGDEHREHVAGSSSRMGNDKFAMSRALLDRYASNSKSRAYLDLYLIANQIKKYPLLSDTTGTAYRIYTSLYSGNRHYRHILHAILKQY